MKQHEIRQLFGNNIRTLRHNRGLNQSQYAALIKVNRTNIGSWEEHRAMPSMETMLEISKLEKVSLDKLVSTVIKDKQNLLAVRG